MASPTLNLAKSSPTAKLPWMLVLVAVAVLNASLLKGQTPDLFVGEWLENLAKGSTTPVNVTTYERNGLVLRSTSTLNTEGTERLLDGVKRPGGSPNATVMSEPYGDNGSRTLRERDGRPVSETILVPSADGKTLTNRITYWTVTGPQIQVATYDRVGGTGNGIAGTWRPRPLEDRKPTLLRISGTDGNLTLAFSSGMTDIADGRPHQTSTDPTAMIHQMSYRRLDANTLEKIGTKEGQERLKWLLKVSPDGKSLTVTENFSSGNGIPITVTTVYDKR